MKNHFIPLMALLALAFPLNAGAKVVTEARARTIAENFLGAAPTRAGAGKLTLLWDGENKQTRSASDPAFYIYSREGGGFVIVAGDDIAHPILGYSYSNNFSVDGMPENLTAWLDGAREEINHERRQCTKASFEIANEWVSAQASTRAGDTIPSDRLHKTAEWNQSGVYNQYAPVFKDNGKQGPIGCVNVAFGILMKFHEYPDRLLANIPGYTASDGNYSVPASKAGHKYDWSKIRLTYKDGEYTDEEGKAVARLLMDIATMAQASFGHSGTGANFTTASTRAITYFGYDPGVYHYNRTYFTVQEWRDVLKKEIAVRPIGYAFYTESGGGHAVVYDGYDSRDYFHINFGWGGSSNGYYCNDITCTTSPLTFTQSHTAYFSIKPKDGGKYFLQYYMTGTGLSCPKASSITPGKAFTVGITIGNNSAKSGASNGQIIVGLCNKDGELIEPAMSPKSTTLSSGYYITYSDISCKFDSKIKFGDMLKVFYREAGTTEWIPVSYNKNVESPIGEIHLTDDTTMAEQNTLSYDKKTKKYTLVGPSNSEAKLLDANGNEVKEGFAARYGKIQLDGNVLAPGRYTLVVSAKKYEDIFQLGITIK